MTENGDDGSPENGEETPTNAVGPEEKCNMPFFKRFMKTFLLDKTAFRSLECDKWGLLHGFIAVLIIGGLRGLGRALAVYEARDYLNLEGELNFPALVFNGVTSFMFVLPLEWLILTGITYFYGGILMKGKKSFGNLVRGVAFTLNPFMLEILYPLAIFSSPLTLILLVVTQMWLIAILITAVSEILKLPRWRGTIATVLSYITFFFVAIFLLGEI